jgi:hypothetical protein
LAHNAIAIPQLADFVIPRNRDLSGWTRFSCSDEAAQTLRIPELALKVGTRPLKAPGVPADAADLRKRSRSLYYRCRLRNVGWDEEHQTPRFSLDFGHPKSTLLVLADYWTACGLEWTSIQDVTNKRWHLQRADFITTASAA